MFVLNDDLSIYATRGDIVAFAVTAEDNGKPYTFKAGNLVRVKIFGKKDAESVVMQKDFPVVADTESVDIFLAKEDTKFGEVISKPKDYWYEVELNPLTDPQTIIGYDEDGAKVFKLFPEGDDIEEYKPTEEDIPFVDTSLDLSSARPVENQVIARAIIGLTADFEETKAEVVKKSDDTAASLAIEKARLDNLVEQKNVIVNRTLEYLDYISEETKAKVDGNITSDGVFATVHINHREANLFVSGSGMAVFYLPIECRPIDIGVIHTAYGMEYSIDYEKASNTYRLVMTAQGDFAPTEAGTVNFTYALDNYEVKDIRVGANGTIYPTAGDAVRLSIKQVTNAINKIIIENIYDTSVQTTETITDNAYIQAGTLRENANYFVTAPIDVSRFAGSDLYFNVLLHGYAVEPARVSCFDANGNFITEHGLNGKKYTVPVNASYIRCTVWKETYWNVNYLNKEFMILTSDVEVDPFPYGVKYLIPELEVASTYKIAVDVRENKVNFTAPSGSKYLNYSMQYFSGGKNAFFDFDKIAETEEFNAFPINKTTVFSNGSDFFGPYVVKALTNIDGDKPDSLNFTGASHVYSGNTDSTTSATGRSIVNNILIDGVKKETYNGYCNTIDIYWTNYVQATNTKKEDGSGREVLKENYHLRFDGYNFEIENDITALEDVQIVRYYGLQIAQGVKGYSYDISYVGGYKNIVAPNGNSKSGDITCREIYIKRKDTPVECRFGLHPIGLGNFYCNNWYSAFDTDYGKSYFFMICPDKACMLLENQQLNFKGYYKFRYSG